MSIQDDALREIARDARQTLLNIYLAEGLTEEDFRRHCAETCVAVLFWTPPPVLRQGA